MVKTKKPWKSVTFWGIMADMILKGLETGGVVPPGTPAGIATVVGSIADVVALWGRWRADKPLSVKGDVS